MTRLCGSCCLPTGLVARLYVTLPHISLAHPTRIWPFELPHKRQHAQLGIRTRKERPFPDALTGLGWCTWDSLGRDVNEQAIVNKMEEFQAKHVPISWVLIDDGWSNTDRTKETLIDFGADRQRFPHGGLAHTIALLKTHYGVRSVGVWRRSKAIGMVWTNRCSRGPAARPQ